MRRITILQSISKFLWSRFYVCKREQLGTGCRNDDSAEKPPVFENCFSHGKIGENISLQNSIWATFSNRAPLFGGVFNWRFLTSRGFSAESNDKLCPPSTNLEGSGAMTFVKSIIFPIVTVIVICLLIFEYRFKQAFTIGRYEFLVKIDENEELFQQASIYALTKSGLNTNVWRISSIEEWYPRESFGHLPDRFSIRIPIHNTNGGTLFLRSEPLKQRKGLKLHLYRPE